jgi:hypothetical protein
MGSTRRAFTPEYKEARDEDRYRILNACVSELRAQGPESAGGRGWSVNSGCSQADGWEAHGRLRRL